jgi:hypothetical protein
MEHVKAFAIAAGSALAMFFVIGVAMSFARRRFAFDPIERTAAALDAALPRMAPAVAS